MNYYEIKNEQVSCDLVEINELEVALRLKTNTGYSNEATNRVMSELCDVACYKYAYTLVPVSIEENYVNLGFTKVKSADLSKNLKGCESAIILATTIGIGVDRYLNRKNLTSCAQGFIADAIASAQVESLCDYVNQLLKKEFDLKPRYSPGYGDLSLEIQKPLLELLSADKTLGITLNESLLMTPVKSITAIIGVLK